MSNVSYLRLSSRDQAVVRDVTRFRQLSSHQILRLHFADNSERSRHIRCNRTLRRLVSWGVLRRIERAIGGAEGGSSGYFYVTPTSKARLPNPHTYDIAELYCRLVESSGEDLIAFDPEPMSHVSVGHVELKPDAFLDIRTSRGRLRAFIEVDLSSEWKTQLSKKMRGYVLAYEKWRDSTFPLVVFVVPDQERQRLIEGVVKRQETPGLFAVVLFEDAVSYLTGE